MKRDQTAIMAAITYAWSQGQVEGQINRLKLIKCQAYGEPGLICYGIESWLVLHELSPGDDGEPQVTTVSRQKRC